MIPPTVGDLLYAATRSDFDIRWLPGKWVEATERYDYARDKTRCPVCGGIGMPWLGWFRCEYGPHIALVESGRTFVGVNEK